MRPENGDLAGKGKSDRRRKGGGKGMREWGTGQRMGTSKPLMGLGQTA